MTMAASDVVDRARSMVGVKFRPQGRDPATGLDCVGVVVRAFGIPPESVRRDYRLRGAHCAEIDRVLSRWFERIAPEQTCLGDVMLFEVSQSQIHLAIACGGTFVHADASIRRVVETPMPPDWPLRGAFRRPTLLQRD